MNCMDGLNGLCNTISINDSPMIRSYLNLEIPHKLEVYATFSSINLSVISARVIICA